MTRMKRAAALLAYARRRLADPPHLQGVRFTVNDRLRATLARVDVEQRIVELSPAILVDADDATFDDVLLHEIAHLLSGERRTHGPLWRDWHLHLGGSGNATHRVVCR